MFINTSMYRTPGNLAIYTERRGEGVLVREGRAFKDMDTAVASAAQRASAPRNKYVEIRTRQGAVVWSSLLTAHAAQQLQGN